MRGSKPWLKMLTWPIPKKKLLKSFRGWEPLNYKFQASSEARLLFFDPSTNFNIFHFSFLYLTYLYLSSPNVFLTFKIPLDLTYQALLCWHWIRIQPSTGPIRRYRTQWQDEGRWHLWSISSTFYMHVFHTKVFLKLFSSFKPKTQLCKILAPKFCTKNARLKRWWNWHLRKSIVLLSSSIKLNY